MSFIGLLETHKRRETADKAIGLEIIPRRKVPWSGVTLTEMDTDTIIARQPQLALISDGQFPAALRRKMQG